MTQQPQHFLQTRKKPNYPVIPPLLEYLAHYGRCINLPVDYSRLSDFNEAAPLYDNQGRDTLWESVIYPQHEMKRLSRDLTVLYVMLKADGDLSLAEHLYADRIDYCTFGNSNPFRIRIVNALNDNQDYYYVKKADASRIYGLELEHLLSPNRMLYYTNGTDTLVEEHVVGIPGDVFIDRWMDNPNFKPVRLAKELVKFNERCFIRLLGDMRSYNFVVDLTPDFEEVQIRIRAMDFDQQSYSGRKNFYLPQFFRENTALAQYCIRHINPTTAYQYQKEERTQILRRTRVIRDRLAHLLQAMRQDTLSTPEKVLTLGMELADHYQSPRFEECRTMADLLQESIRTAGLAMQQPGAPLGPG